MRQCSSCGYVWNDEEAPDKCPNCGTPGIKFTKLNDRAMDMVENSRFTNSLHMQLYVLLEQLMDVAEDGIDDNLDPNCVKIFKSVLEEAEILQQSIKAELQGHMKKGKWG